MTTRSFAHTAAGTPESTWATSRLGQAPRLSVPGRGHVLVVVAAHPDDETLGAGGLLMLAAAAGATVRLVVATDGEASHPASSTHDPARLATVRRAEVQAAAGELGSGIAPVLLGLPDGGLADHREALGHLIEPHLAGATHVVTTWVGDGHPDHEAVATVTAQLLADRTSTIHWQYPIWSWHWADPDRDDMPWNRIGLIPLTPDARAAKNAAIHAYASQHSPLSPAPGDEAVLPPAVLRHFDRDYEAFIVATPRAVHPGYFDALYARAGDPWGLADRFYERRKRDLLLAALPRESFRRAFEPGCATGELTVRLAERCKAIEAWDVAAAAVQLTVERVPPHVLVRAGAVPSSWPAGSFDLIVLSEVGYYCRDLDLLIRRVRGSLAPDTVVVACHWRRPAPDHPQTAEDVHATLQAGLRGFAHSVRHEEQDFLLDVWGVDRRSVAEADGLLG